MNALIFISILLFIYSVITSFKNHLLEKEIKKQKFKYEVEKFVVEYHKNEIDYLNNKIENMNKTISILIDKPKSN